MARKLTFIMVLFALALGVLIVPATATYADESPSTEYYNAQYDFSYEETVMPTNQIVRKYEKPETSIFSTNSTRNSVTKTKAILASLGMGEDFIDALSTEQLNEYANSKSIVATEAFIKTDAEGNSTYVTESEAREGARGFVPPGASEEDFGDEGGVGTPPGPYWESESVDEYMKLVFSVAYRGAGLYHYSVDAEWLQPPIYYFKDSLGACVQNATLVEGSRTGWYAWEAADISDSDNTISDMQILHGEDVNDSGSDFQDDTKGVWEGTAATFDFPSPITLLIMDRSYAYTEMLVHVEFDARVSDVSNERYFNAAATYAHSHITIDIDPSIEISFGGIIPSIGIHAWVGIEYRPVGFNEPFHYIPDSN